MANLIFPGEHDELTRRDAGKVAKITRVSLLKATIATRYLCLEISLQLEKRGILQLISFALYTCAILRVCVIFYKWRIFVEFEEFRFVIYIDPGYMPYEFHLFNIFL